MSKIECKYKFYDAEKFDGKPYCTLQNELCEDLSFACDDNCQVYEDYKQLKRKEQENEKLKEENFTFEQLIKEYEKYGAIEEIIQQLDQLKAENDELKEKVKELRQGWINCDKERSLQEANSEFRQRVINRYKRTLMEIKNIAEEQAPYLNIGTSKTVIEIEYDYASITYNLDQRMYKILQKISECEVNND